MEEREGKGAEDWIIEFVEQDIYTRFVLYCPADVYTYIDCSVTIYLSTDEDDMR